MLQEYWDIWAHDIFGGHVRLAAAALAGIVGGGVVGLFKMFFRNDIDSVQRKFHDERREKVAGRLGPAATSAEIDAEIERVIARERAEALEVPDIVIQLAQRPQDGRYFDALRRFAQTKYQNSQALHPLETLSRGPLGFVADMLGSDGPACLDRYDTALPHRTWELQNAVRQIGLPDYADPIDKATGIYLHRKQFLMDAIATGMPREQAAAHPDLPGYDGVAGQLGRLGGYETFVAAADAYLKENYPWQDAGQ
ncbi:hypothetical protein [Yoonia sp. 2307UL14-13]|uniref:hypothetical protein n=1 Tax=Yoonia sp. 2307UL14-13 TaxID=3126506 RepID=UPI0030AC5B6D